MAVLPNLAPSIRFTSHRITDLDGIRGSVACGYSGGIGTPIGPVIGEYAGHDET